ncbi:16S rRNA (guanine(966)-N(2))-methyltransferase RsmD [Chloroflexota bacterium]
MRIITGSAKGQRLKSPKTSTTRPTTALVKKALFSSLDSLVDDWERVLDLYAGSGALGIEALSLGAGWVDFVEKVPKCCAIIKENLERTGFTAQAKVYCCSVSKALTRLNGEYDIVLLDAPYSDPSLLGTLGDLFSSQLVGTGSTVAVQHSSRQSLPPEIEKLHLVRDRHYGDTCLSIYKQGGAN